MTKDKGLPLTSNHWGTYRAKVKNGKVEELVGWEHDKDPSPIAQGIVDAVQETNLSIPLVVRLAGTNVELGKEILKKSNLKIIPASNLSDAAKKIVEATK